jgi:hypothetical protein
MDDLDIQPTTSVSTRDLKMASTPSLPKKVGPTGIPTSKGGLVGLTEAGSGDLLESMLFLTDSTSDSVSNSILAFKKRPATREQKNEEAASITEKAEPEVKKLDAENLQKVRFLPPFTPLPLFSTCLLFPAFALQLL